MHRRIFLVFILSVSVMIEQKYVSSILFTIYYLVSDVYQEYYLANDAPVKILMHISCNFCHYSYRINSWYWNHKSVVLKLWAYYIWQIQIAFQELVSICILTNSIKLCLFPTFSFILGVKKYKLCQRCRKSIPCFDFYCFIMSEVKYLFRILKDF